MSNVHAFKPKPQDATEQWISQIGAEWQKGAQSVIATGKLLIEAKAALGHGPFGAMIEAKLPFSAGTAQRLMAIARNPVISNPAHAPLLPPSWMTLYVLSKIDLVSLRGLFAIGEVFPEMERDDAEALRQEAEAVAQESADPRQEQEEPEPEEDADKAHRHAKEKAKEAFESARTEHKTKKSQDRSAERKTQHDIALELIDAGFKALALKYHPDKGGSNADMQRLNRVRKWLLNRAAPPGEWS